jgi:hypothetical protein
MQSGMSFLFSGSNVFSYDDGSVLLIRTNPKFQILFTNTMAHTAPIISLAWRPEFSTARTYTEKDGKVHKASAEDMTLLASCPTIKGEFRIWAWSSKAEKLTTFREEKTDGMEMGGSGDRGTLHWSRNGKVVQFIEGYQLYHYGADNQGGSNLGCEEATDSK